MTELDPARLTDGQRAKFLDLVADPSMGHVRAARTAGARGSRGQIQRMLTDDEELQDDIQEIRRQVLRSKGIGVDDLLTKLASIVNDDGNPSQYRAIVYLLGMQGIHVTEKQQIEVTGAAGGPIEVEGGRVTGIAEVFELARALGAGVRDGLSAEPPRPALPAAPEVLPDPRDG